MSEAVVLERLLRRDRLITIVSLIALWALAWLYLLRGGGLGMDARELTRLALLPTEAGQMAGSMPMGHGPNAMATGRAAWDPALWTLMVVMWWVMMLAMMTPSAAPAILLYGRVHKHALANRNAAQIGPIWAFASGYLLVWFAFSCLATALHWWLEHKGFLSATMMASQSQWLSAAVLAAAGAYQLSPLQNVCLDHCRSPASFFSRHWRPGALGSVRLGVLHGGYCVGCCWMLMGLLFVGGVMNLLWIAALSLLVLAEKILRGGRWIARLTGFLLLAWAAATLAA